VVPKPPSENLPNLTSVLNKHGLSSNMKVTSKVKPPNVKKAQELWKLYSSPIIIKLNDKSNTSELHSSFGKYIPGLIALSSKIQIKMNSNNDLEIHGPPEARAEILSFLANLEDNLSDTKVNTFTIVMDNIQNDSSIIYEKLFLFLFKKAKKFVLQNYSNTQHKLQTHTLRINSELLKGCPVGIKFLNALKKLKLDPNDPEKIFAKGIPFGWHGTKTDQNLTSIAHENLDPTRRYGQVFGPGEYCAQDPAVATGYWGNTNTLILFFILKSNFYTINTHHIVNNPSPNEMYMVPILIATFNNQVPINFECKNRSSQKKEENKINYSWEWKDDDGWKAYGLDRNGAVTDNCIQSAKTIENGYKSYQKGSAVSTMGLNFVRLKDGATQNYLIDFENRNQTNQSTKFQREIRRLVNNNEKWE